MKCVQCKSEYNRWESVGNPSRYCCPKCWNELLRIECWGSSRVFKRYMKKRKTHMDNTVGQASWVTICPTGEISIENFHKIIHKLKSGNLVRSGWWVYEWRHRIADVINVDNDGLHAHMYLKVTNVNRFKLKVKRMCRRHGWDAVRSPVLVCEYPENEKIDYCTGKTNCSDKNIKKEKDKVRREKLKIKHFFNCKYVENSIGGRLTYTDTMKDEWKGLTPMNDTDDVQKI